MGDKFDSCFHVSIVIYLSLILISSVAILICNLAALYFVFICAFNVLSFQVCWKIFQLHFCYKSVYYTNGVHMLRKLAVICNFCNFVYGFSMLLCLFFNLTIISCNCWNLLLDKMVLTSNKLICPCIIFLIPFTC